jgi:WD40 repeat protein
VNDRQVALTGGEDGMLRVWDLRDGKPYGKPMRGHAGPIWAVAFGTLSGRPIALTGGEDKTARVWDLATRRQLGAPFIGHTDRIWTVALGMLGVSGPLGGRPVAITGGRDETIRLWSLDAPPPSPNAGG